MKSPIQFDDLNLKFVPKGTLIICPICGSPTPTGVDMHLGTNEAIICHPCANKAEGV